MKQFSLIEIVVALLLAACCSGSWSGNFKDATVADAHIFQQFEAWSDAITWLHDDPENVCWCKIKVLPELHPCFCESILCQFVAAGSATMRDDRHASQRQMHWLPSPTLLIPLASNGKERAMIFSKMHHGFSSVRGHHATRHKERHNCASFLWDEVANKAHLPFFWHLVNKGGFSWKC